jgi:hypothetical protein
VRAQVYPTPYPGMYRSRAIWLVRVAAAERKGIRAAASAAIARYWAAADLASPQRATPVDTAAGRAFARATRRPGYMNRSYRRHLGLPTLP